MDTAIVISITLLLFFAYAIYQYTKDSDGEVKELMQKEESYLLADLASIKLWVWITSIAGFMFTAGYALNFMSGSTIAYIDNWGASQWVGMVSGLMAALVITGAQKNIYTSYSAEKAGLVGTGLIIIFVVFSEVSAPIEREELKVKEISQNSQTYQAVVGAIKGGRASPSAYSLQLANAEAELAKDTEFLNTCGERYKKSKRLKKCKESNSREVAQDKALIASYKRQMKAETTSNQSTALALVDKAKALENNQDNHSGIIKTMMEVLGVPVESAMLLASLLFITAFEIAFHYLGTRQAVLTEALVRLGNVDIGYAEEYKRMKKAQKFRAKTDGLRAIKKTTQDKDSPKISINRIIEKAVPQHIGFTPATNFTSNKNTGTHEQQYDMFVQSDKTPSKEAIENRVKLELDIARMKAEIDTLREQKQARKPRFKLKLNKQIEQVLPAPKNQQPEAEKTPVSDHSPTGSETPVLDRMHTVDTGAKTGDINPDKKASVEAVQSTRYEDIKKDVVAGIVKPTIRAITKRVYEDDKVNLPMPKCQKVAEKIMVRLLEDKVCKGNPNYKNGLPKYLLANKDRVQRMTSRNIDKDDMPNILRLVDRKVKKLGLKGQCYRQRMIAGIDLGEEYTGVWTSFHNEKTSKINEIVDNMISKYREKTNQ